tara:strand:- start:1269 stop:1754 length:486 start_codon:yes stop_codon:yes gene_type:complete
VKATDPEIIPIDSLEALAAISDDGPEQGLERRRITEAIDAVLSTLNVRQQFIIAMRHYGEKQMTLRELGEYYGISTGRVREIEQNALRKLRHPSRGLKYLTDPKFQEELAGAEEYLHLRFTPDMKDAHKAARQMYEYIRKENQRRRGIRERNERALKAMFT